MFLYFTIIVTLFVVAGLLPLYIYLSNHLKKEIWTSSDVINRQIISNTDDFLRQMDRKAIRLSINKSMEEIIYRINNDLYDNKADYYRDLSILSGELYSEQWDVPSIHSIYMYMHQQNFIVTERKRLQLAEFEDKAFIQAVLDKGGTQAAWHAPRRMPYGGGEEVISLARPFGIVAGKPQGFIVININRSFLSTFTDQITGLPGAQFLMMTNEGQVISSAPDQQLAAPYGDRLQTMLESGSAEEAATPFREARLDGEQKFIAHGVSQYNEWHYLLIIPKSSLVASMKIARNTMLIITGLCLAIGLLISYWLSKSYYKPIDRLAHLVRSKSSTEAADAKDDFTVLDQSFRLLLEENSHHRHLVREQWENIRNHMLIDILKGNYSDLLAFTEKMKAYGVEFRAPLYQVIGLELDKLHRLETISELDKSLVLYAASNIAQELIGRHCEVQAARVQDHLIALVLHMDEPMTDQQLHAMLVEVREAIRAYVKTESGYAVGSCQTGLPNITHSYREVLAVLKRKVFYEPDSIIFANPLLGDDSFVLHEEAIYSIRQAIVEAIKMRSPESAERHLDSLFDLIAANPNLAVEYVRFISMQVIGDMAGIVYSLFQELPDECRDQLTMYEELKQCRQLREYQDVLVRYCYSVIELLDLKSGSAKSDLVGKVLLYIRTNYSLDLSLETVAERTHFNPSYLGRLIKSATGKTYLMYVTEIRMEKAKELLLDRQLKIAEIYEKVGYSNRQSFIRSFKQYTGLTPTEYREIHHSV